MKKQYSQIPQRENDNILLSAYIDGALLPNERDALEQRLATDDVLRAELGELQATVQLLRDMPAVVLPRSFTLDVAEHTPSRRFWQHGWLQHGWLRLSMGMVAALLILMTLAVLPDMFFAASHVEDINISNGMATISREQAGVSRPAKPVAMAPNAPEEAAAPESAADASDARAVNKTNSQEIAENSVASKRNADADAAIMAADAESMPMEHDMATTITTTHVAEVGVAAMLFDASPTTPALHPMPTMQPVLAQVTETQAIQQQQQAVRLRLLIIILVLIIIISIVAVLFIKHTHRKEP
jgi:anti-sigma factor RsiW